MRGQCSPSAHRTLPVFVPDADGEPLPLQGAEPAVCARLLRLHPTHQQRAYVGDKRPTKATRPRHGACRRLHQRLRGGPGRRHLGSGSLGQTKLEPPALVSAPCRPLISHDSKPKGSCIEMQLNPMLRRFACTSGGATCCTGMAAMYLAWTWRVLGVLLTRGWRAPGVWRTRIE